MDIRAFNSNLKIGQWFFLGWKATASNLSYSQRLVGKLLSPSFVCSLSFVIRLTSIKRVNAQGPIPIQWNCHWEATPKSSAFPQESFDDNQEHI